MATNTDEREEIKPVAPTEQTKWRDPSLVGKYMVDPKTGLAGLFRSPDNGETWVLTDTVYGHVYNQDEVDNIWDSGAGHKVADEIKSATADLPNVRKQADEAVKFAESAIAASKVNSDAIVAQSSAVVEAKSAMDSATAEIQQLKANAASDVAQIRADVARVQNEVDTAKAANAASVDKLKSDIGLAKKDLDNVRDSLTKAQSAVEQNQKLINDSVAKITGDASATKQDLANVHDSLAKVQAAAEANQKAIDQSIAQINSDVDGTKQDLAGVRKDLTKAQADITANQKSINDSVAQINADITQDRKDIASVQQANADTAKQLDAYSKQATAQGKTIKAIQDKQDGFTATLADVQGNVSQVSDKVDGLSASLKDTQGNVASVKAQADQLSATLTDHGKAIATLTASAKELISTLEDAGGRLSKIEQTAKTNSSTLADVQGDLSQVKQDATTLTATLRDAQGNISMLQQKADSVSAQLATAQGDIATLQTGIAGVKATLASHDKSIHTLQLDSKSLKDSMADAQGDISTLSKTATSLDSEMKDHAGRLSKVEQSATTQATTLSDLQGNLTQVKQQADGLVTTLKNAQGSITQIQQKADGTLAQLKSVQGDIASLQTDVTGIKATLVSHEGDIHTLQLDSKTLKDNMADAKGNISSLQKSSTKLDSEMSSQDGRLSKVEQTASEQSTTLSDLQGNLTQVKRQADGLVTTLKDAQGNIDQIKQDAKGTLEQLSNAQGDITALQKDVNGIKLTIADHDKNIHTLQADSKTLKDDMRDAKGNISSLQKTATSLDSEFKDHDGRLSKVEQTATEHSSELADNKNNIDKVSQKADSLQLLLGNAQKDIQNIKIDAKGLHDTLTGQSNQLASLNVTLNNLDSKYSGITGDLQSKQTALSTEQQQTKDMLLRKADKSEVDNVKGTVNQVSAEQKTMADQINQKVSSVEYQTLKDKVNNLRIGGRNLIPNSGTDIVVESKTTDAWAAWKYKVVYYDLTPGEIYTFSVSATNTNNVKDASIRIFSEAQNKEAPGNLVFPADGKRHSTTFTLPKDGVSYSVYLYAGCMGKIEGKNFTTTYHHPQLELGNIESDYSPNPDDTITSIQKNATAIDENSKLISLMAKQTDVDNIKGTAQQLIARLDVMAGEVKSKVDETRVNGLIDARGYATSSTVQSLISQKAGQLSESITNLETKFNSSSSVNLAEKTNQGITNWMCDPGNGATNLTEINVNGVRGVRFNNSRKTTSWWVVKYALDLNKYEPNTDYVISFDIRTPVDVELFGSMFDIAGGDSLNGYFTDTSIRGSIPANKLTHISVLKHTKNELDKAHYQSFYLDSWNLSRCDWVDFVNFKIARGTIDKGYSPAPSDNATVTQVQSIQASIDGLQSNVTNYKNDTNSKYTQLSNLMQSKVDQGDLSSVRTQLANAINERVQKGELLSQINLTAGNTLIQSNKLYLDASSVVITGTAFIPSAAIASLSADKVTTGWLNTNNVSLGDGRTRIRADHDYMYIQPTGSSATNSGIRMSYTGLDFLTDKIPNGNHASVPYYSIGYDGASNGYLRISAFDHINPGGTTATQNWYTMVDAISLTNNEINFATKGNMHMQVVNGGVNIKPTLFFQNNTNNGTFAGFNRLDNSNTVEFNTGDNDGENFHVNSGARFMKYVYFNDYCRAQGWLTYSTLSKKTNIKKLDTSLALDKIRQDDQYLYEYKRNVAKGVYDPQASFIIDDVNDVSHYSVPREFIDQTGKYREPSVELSYLIAAFQEIDKQVQLQQAEIKELKEKLQHE